MFKEQMRLRLAQGRIDNRDVFIPRKPTDMQRAVIESLDYRPSMATLRRQLRLRLADD